MAWLEILFLVLSTWIHKNHVIHHVWIHLFLLPMPKKRRKTIESEQESNPGPWAGSYLGLLMKIVTSFEFESRLGNFLCKALSEKEIFNNMKWLLTFILPLVALELSYKTDCGITQPRERRAWI